MSLPSIKTQQEIESMRKGGKILGNLLQTLKTAAKPGVTTEQLDQLTIKICSEKGVIPTFLGYKGYPATICTSVNDEVVHAIPNSRLLKTGDLLSIDCGITFEGMVTDAAVSLIIGNADNKLAQKLIQAAENALFAGINQIKPGNNIGDIGFAIQEVVHKAGFHIIKELTGHGVGKHLHEEPIINNFGSKGSGPAIKPGMTFAIEPIIAAGSRFIQTLDDDWTIVTKDGSLAVQVEHTILVTPRGNEILTLSS
ncbi:MAG: hypothetical protein ACD_65C00126G0003 [uncultured bacterium]|nr:MAG: hypothetical protein ACD_65C00126G0003 [uncultured bacterium]KKT02476.1 MAG: methionine aminopeptidase, methionyl aminopeptidase [Candidatus Peregrinibacteria bacterium GW2011_GWF2_43_17]KKT19763.1 MAG: Methionine aminopeptidase [Candidatus Peregrinibacteria bacterium GW2011_GWA2_43_8]HAU40198.1 type I methionyl aminopeptidase [Candidatus Peregrinibacteria bacterium]